MVSTVNSHGIPGRETAGGYDIHHGHSRQATLHTAFLNSAGGINSSQGHPHRIAGFIPCRWTSINPKGML